MAMMHLKAYLLVVLLAWVIMACGSVDPSVSGDGDLDADAPDTGDIDRDDPENDADPDDSVDPDGDLDAPDGDGPGDGDGDETDRDDDDLFFESPYACTSTPGKISSRPELTWVNPFPRPILPAVEGLIDGEPLFMPFGAPTRWPSRVQAIDPGNERERTGGSFTKAWGHIWVGNNSGGIWQADTTGKPWITVTEMYGSATLSLLYEPENDRIIGWGGCDLFVRYQDGRSEIKHFWDDSLNDAGDKRRTHCTIAGTKISYYSYMQRLNGETFLYVWAFEMSDDWETFFWRAEVYKLVDMDFEKVCEIPINQSLLPSAFRLDPPAVVDGRLYLPSLFGELWSFDGTNCQKVLQDERLNEDPIRSIAGLNGDIYVNTPKRVYKIENGQLIEDLVFERNESLLYFIKSDPERKLLYLSGGFDFMKPFLAVKTEDSDWRSLSRILWEDKEDVRKIPDLTQLTFGPNGKGFAGGQGAILRYDGIDWYIWLKGELETVDLYTPDGETLLALTEKELCTLSEADGMTCEALPEMTARTATHFVTSDDGLYILGQNGLLLEVTDGAFKLLNTGSNKDFLEGLAWNDKLLLSTGTRLFLYDFDSIERIALPSSTFVNWEPKDKDDLQIRITKDRQGQVWLARTDGVWILSDGMQWSKVTGECNPLYNMQLIAPYSDGVIRVCITDVELVVAWMDIITTGDDGYAVQSRSMHYTSGWHAPYVGAALNEERTVFGCAESGLMEYGTYLPIPCYGDDRADRIPISDVQTETVDLESFGGECTSSGAMEIPECNEGSCYIPGGDYCIGADISQNQFRGRVHAYELPTRSYDIDAFQIGEHTVSRREFVDFLNSRPSLEHAGYTTVRLNTNEESYVSIDYQNGQFILLDDPNLPDSAAATFANQAGARAYCESEGKRLCSALEWEAACRGFDDDAYPEGKILTSMATPDMVVSDFGVIGMSVNYYEWVSDLYAHDTLRYPEASLPDHALPMMKGRICWSRKDHYEPWRIDVAFRCCEDVGSE